MLIDVKDTYIYVLTVPDKLRSLNFTEVKNQPYTQASGRDRFYPLKAGIIIIQVILFSCT